MKPHILFDLDGTLTDPSVGITRCIQYALEKGGHTVPEAQDLYSWIGPPLHESFVAHLPQISKAHAMQLVSFYRERFAEIGMFENKVFEGIDSLLNSLQVDKRLHLATSKPHFFAKKILKHFKLDRYFTSIHGSELTGERSDKGELIQFILEMEKLGPNDCLMVGDRKHDVLGAKKHGIPTVGVLWGHGPREELEEAGALHIVQTPEELLSYLGKKK